jgi:predicted DNA-binding transcriptional regulator AlpA
VSIPATSPPEPPAVLAQKPSALAVVPDALVAAVVAAVRANVGPLPQLFDQADAMRYVGLPRSTWFRLRSADELPAPVAVPGSGPRWRRADLDKWLAKLKPARRKSRAAETERN